jgi:twitching motility protein PilT
MMATSAVRNLIREGKSFQIDNVIQTSADAGMMLLETSLMQWVQRGSISMETARSYALRPDELDRMSHTMGAS